MLEAVYPYTGTDNSCKYDVATSSYLKIGSYDWFRETTNVAGLKTRVAAQPISVGIASCDLFMSMSGDGIFDDDAC